MASRAVGAENFCRVNIPKPSNHTKGCSAKPFFAVACCIRPLSPLAPGGFTIMRAPGLLSGPGVLPKQAKGARMGARRWKEVSEEESKNKGGGGVGGVGGGPEKVGERCLSWAG